MKKDSREFLIGQISAILETATTEELRVLLAAARAYIKNKSPSHM